MGLIDRILRVIRSNTNQLTSQAEDPEKILEQTVVEMQENLVQLRQALASAIASQKRTERQIAQAQLTAQEWHSRAQMALQKDNEALAREALTKSKSYQQTATAMQAQIEQQNIVTIQMKQDMRSLESKIAEAKTKKDMFIARARSAQASQKINEMLGGMGSTSSKAFAQMEEKVLQLEAQSEAIAELGTDELQKKFTALESSNDVDAELAAMKAQLPEAKGNEG